MKHVALIIPTLTGGGAERVIVTLAKHLDRRRFRVTLAVVDTRRAVMRREIPDDVTFIDLGARRVRHALPRIVSMIRRTRPDIMLSTLGHLNVALAMVRFLLPAKLRTVARESTVVSSSLAHQKYRTFWKALYRRFYRRHDEVICQSQFMRDDLVRHFGFPAARARVINNPVDVDRVRSLASEAISFSSPSGAVNLVAAGRLDVEKGFDLLIEALALLDQPLVHVTLLGEGPLEGDLKRRAEQSGVRARVHFAGFQQNPFPWFAKADAFVLSSHYEGFPNVVLESLACGTPVIATPAPGGTGEILEGIDGCVLAREVSSPALAEAIDKWMRGPRSRIAGSAVEPYRLERILQQYEAALLDERRA
jgi:glycosyltransferase involved in cell wall biosynthesis